jgi:hypothetical protein
LLLVEDVTLSMPPLATWFDGRDAVAAFIEEAIFAAARSHGVHLAADSCNGQRAFATYQPDGQGCLVASVLQLADVDGQVLLTAWCRIATRLQSRSVPDGSIPPHQQRRRARLRR